MLADRWVTSQARTSLHYNRVYIYHLSGRRLLQFDDTALLDQSGSKHLINLRLTEPRIAYLLGRDNGKMETSIMGYIGPTIRKMCGLYRENGMETTTL